MNDSTDKKTDDQAFWRALRKRSPASEAQTQTARSDLGDDSGPLTDEQREQRRRSLLSMLAANQARQEKVQRNRLPALVPGLVIGIRSGRFSQRRGTVMDADYIHGRALLQIDGEEASHWIDFARLAPLGDDGSSESDPPETT